MHAIETRLFINNEYVEAKSGKKFSTYNPATEKVLAQVHEAGQEDVDIAVKAARKAFDEGEWRKMPAYDRGLLIYNLGKLIESNVDQLARLQSLNNGKPFANSRTQDVPLSARYFIYYAGWCDKIKGSTLQTSGPFHAMTKKVPVGVVAQIIPWNYPLMMLAWKISPALAAGCTIVLKPAQQTPLTALLLGRLIKEAGFPPGVINIIAGDGRTGAMLTHHHLVDKIAFTGSTEVGYKIMRESHVNNLKRVTLELGGKSANIIFEDADLEIAVPQACVVFSNSGQSCIAGSRTFVHEKIHTEFVNKCIEYAKTIKVGDPFVQGTTQGPQISQVQFDSITKYIGLGEKQGAKLAFGGRRVGDKGFFIEPTIFTNVQDHMTIAKQEIFGPVMSIFKFSTEEEVVKRANSLKYGLGAGLVTQDIDRAMRVMNQLEAGTVYVNTYDVQDTTTPFGGVKDSGMGRELGEEGLNTYLETKTFIIKK